MPNHLEDLSPVVRNRILNYKTKLLDPTAATAVLPHVRELVASAQPASSDVARQYMSTVCKFLADVSAGRTCSLDLLVDVEVARWVSLAKAAGMPHTTLQGHAGRLNALLRVRSGLPRSLAVKGKAPAYESPYSAFELAAVFGQIGQLGDGPLAVVVALLGAGLPPSDAVGGRLCDENGRVLFVTAAGLKRPVVSLVAAQAGDLSASAVVAKEDWAAAKEAADAVGVKLRENRGLQTYRVAVLGDGRPVGVALSEFPLGEKALGAARQFLPTVDQRALSAILRG